MLFLKQSLILLSFVLLGLIVILKDLDLFMFFYKKELGIIVILIFLYNIFNNWLIKVEKGIKTLEIIIIINVLSIILFILNKEEIGLIYIILEIYSMSIYILINYNNKNNILFNIKYFFLNSISSMFLLFIFSLIYYFYGIINLRDYIYINNTYLFYLFVFILLFKLGIFPFNYWIKESYKELDIKILLLQTIFTKFIYLYLILSLPFSSYDFIIIISILNLIAISIIGININKLKELLIISSLFNLSLLLFSSFSHILFFYYFILYALNSFLIFYFLLFPFNLSLLFLFLFSLIGFPPFGGFYIKFFILFNSFNFSSFLSYPFILFLLFSTLLSVNFYLKIINYFSLSFSSSFLLKTSDNLLIISFLSFFLLFFSFYHTFYFFLLFLFL